MHGHPMETNIIIYYDKGFIKNFEELKTLLDAGERPKLYQFLLDKFGFIFKMNQVYWIRIAKNNGRDFLETGKEIQQELMRPLSHRQYRLIEGSFCNQIGFSYYSPTIPFLVFVLFLLVSTNALQVIF